MDKITPKYWIACSGGVDSVVLVHIMAQLKHNLGVLHCNFQLRGKASDEDEQFVRELAAHYSLPIQVKKFTVPTTKNTQLTARNLRYKWFEEVRKKDGACIVLAHHQDDQVETFLIQLSRGGWKGLAAMPIYRAGYVRPLLSKTKSDLIDLAKKNNWSWREDVSNTSDRYERNYYRLHLLPLLKENGIYTDILSLISDYQKLVHQLKVWNWTVQSGDSVYLSQQEWNKLPILLRKELLEQFNIPSSQVSEFSRWITEGIKGGKLEGSTYTVWHEGEGFYFQYRGDDTPLMTLEVHPVERTAIDFNSSDFYVDADKIKGELQLCTWEIGDRFQPYGMRGSKLVSDFLTDKKVPAHQRKDIHVVKDTENIIAVVGFTISNSVAISDKTERIWRLSIVIK